MPGDAAPPRIFISYSRTDVELATWLNRRLERDGRFDVLRDVEDTEYGEDWWNRVLDMIRQSDSVVLLLSSRSSRSETCAREVDEALALGKRIFPLIVEELDWKQVPAGLARIHAVVMDSASTDGRERGAELLETAMSRDIDWVRTHTRVGELAQRWDGRGRRSQDLMRGTALAEAEAWLRAAPADASVPTRLHRDFLAAGRRSVRSRRRSGAVIALVALMALAIAGVAALFYNADSRLNAARLALQGSSVAEAQASFEDWGDDVLARFAPATGSGATLASRLLDHGLIAQTARLAGGGAALRPIRMRAVRGAVYALFAEEDDSGYPTAAAMVRCSDRMAKCRRIKVPTAPETNLELLADGDRVFLARTSFGGRPTIWSVDWGDGRLTALALDRLPVRRGTGGSRWRTRNDANDLGGAELLGQGSRLEISPEGDAGSRYRLPSGEQSVNGAACDGATLLCVVSVPLEARANVVRYDVWRYGQGERADMPLAWSRSAQSVYAPPLSRNTLAMTGDGSRFAISADGLVTLWESREVLRGNAAPGRSFRFGDRVDSLVFGPDGTVLYVGVGDSVSRVTLFPRGTVVKAPDPTRASWLSPGAEEGQADDGEWSDLFGDLAAVRAVGPCGLEVDADGRPNILVRLSRDLCQGDGSILSVEVVQSGRRDALLRVTSSSDEEAATLDSLLLASLDRTAVRLRRVRTGRGTVSTNASDGTAFVVGGDRIEEIRLRGSGATVRRMPLSGDLSRLMARRAGGAAVRQVASGVYAATVDAAGCRPPRDAGLGLEVSGSNLVLASARPDGMLHADLYVRCLPGLTPVDDDNHRVAFIPADGGRRLFIGTYYMQGVLEWEVAGRSLRHHALAADPGVRVMPASPAVGADYGVVDLRSMPLIQLGVTDGAFSDGARLLAFYGARGGSIGSSYGVGLYDIGHGGVLDINAPSVDTFDYVEAVAFNGSGSLVLIQKTVSGPMLFLSSGGGRLALPGGLESAEFVGDDMLRLQFASGMAMCWLVPEAGGFQAEALRTMLRRDAPAVGTGCRSTVPRASPVAEWKFRLNSFVEPLQALMRPSRGADEVAGR